MDAFSTEVLYDDVLDLTHKLRIVLEGDRVSSANGIS